MLINLLRPLRVLLLHHYLQRHQRKRILVDQHDVFAVAVLLVLAILAAVYIALDRLVHVLLVRGHVNEEAPHVIVLGLAACLNLDILAAGTRELSISLFFIFHFLNVNVGAVVTEAIVVFFKFMGFVFHL
jgi:hypothetical protein